MTSEVQQPSAMARSVEEPTDDDLVRRFRRVRFFWFWVLVAGYLIVGRLVTQGLGWVSGDALSRVASARFAIGSRDPHLSAIGFVFTPLTTLLELPLVALLSPWPALLAQVVPGAVVSSMAMAGAVLQLTGILRDRRASEGWVLAIGAIFALHPMIVLYGGNGMSEALFLLCMMVCCRFLLRWLASDDVHDLAGVGLSIGAGYLVRYDAVAVAVAVALLVGVFSLLRSRGSRRQRRDAALMDIAVVVMPALTAFTLWALVSWLITGEAFQQFTSEYGNSAIVAATASADSAPATIGDRVLVQLLDWLALEPAIFVVLLVSLAIGLIRWIPDFLPPLFVFGSVLLFQLLTFSTGGTFALLRFSITVIPMAVVMVAVMRPRFGILFTRRAGPAALLSGSRRQLARRRSVATRWAVVVLLLPAMVVSVLAMSRPTIGPKEFGVVTAVLPGVQSPQVRLAGAQQLRTFHAEREIAAELDAMGLPDGAVLTDTVYGFAVVVASRNPRQFTINSDFDFVNRLNDPRERGVQYLLTVPETGRGTSDAINRRYPGIYENGAGIGFLVREFPTSGSSDQPTAFRLYRVTGS